MQSSPPLLTGFLPMADVCAAAQTRLQACVMAFLSDTHTRALTNLIEAEAILAQETITPNFSLESFSNSVNIILFLTQLEVCLLLNLYINHLS